ncbi:hypothetical protein GCM10022232_52470 [Streptomyces plumbiresistens]|uniref:Uncharacterized protein n=1 Tax=Streptomyces plumbiresistens TaxID=511811 RepID=A0ABP7S456_9ACTN
MFSAPEGANHAATAASPPPTTSPFQAPDFGEDETFLPNDGQGSASDTGTAQY